MTPDPRSFDDDPARFAHHVSRRALFGRIARLGLGTGGIALLQARAPPTPTPTPAATLAAQPSSAAAAQPAAAAAATTAAPAAQSKPGGQGGTLVVAGDALGDNYMPAVGFQGWAGVWVLNNIFDSLYTFRDFKTLIPALATGHTVSDDGLTYTFELRQGVTFHDGTPFNAAAVEFNYMRYLDKNHPYYDANAIYRTSMLPDVNVVRAKADYTVEIVRAKPMSAFIAALAATYAGILSPTAIKKFGVQEIVRSPVGTGPFVFEKAEKGNQASFVAYDGYWNGRPSLDRVVARVITDDHFAADVLAWPDAHRAVRRAPGVATRRCGSTRGPSSRQFRVSTCSTRSLPATSRPWERSCAILSYQLRCSGCSSPASLLGWSAQR